MSIERSRPEMKIALLLLVSVASLSLVSTSRSSRARAQNPVPSNTFVNQAPGQNFVSPGASGVVVEGLGGSSCWMRKPATSLR